MKKKYETLEAEFVRVESQDVITTSPGTEGPVVPEDNNPFDGSYDINGWT